MCLLHALPTVTFYQKLSTNSFSIIKKTRNKLSSGVMNTIILRAISKCVKNICVWTNWQLICFLKILNKIREQIIQKTVCLMNENLYFSSSNILSHTLQSFIRAHSRNIIVSMNICVYFFVIMRFVFCWIFI